MTALVIVNQIDVRSATGLEAKSDSPEARDADGPEAGAVAFQRMQAGEVGQIAEAAGLVDGGQGTSDAGDLVRGQTAGIIVLGQPAEALVPERTNHWRGRLDRELGTEAPSKRRHTRLHYAPRRSPHSFSPPSASSARGARPRRANRRSSPSSTQLWIERSSS